MTAVVLPRGQLIVVMVLTGNAPFFAHFVFHAHSRAFGMVLGLGFLMPRRERRAYTLRGNARDRASGMALRILMTRRERRAYTLREKARERASGMALRFLMPRRERRAYTLREKAREPAFGMATIQPSV